jgi:hypothetical protein
LDTFAPEECIVKKVIRLSAAKYDRFAGNMLRDQDFIRQNRELMKHENGMRGCLLVVGEDRRDGILVDSSGHDYARYTAFIPNAEALLTVGQHPDLAWLNEKLTEIAEYIAEQNGEIISINIGEMDAMFGIDLVKNPTLVSTVMGMLGDMPVIGPMKLDKNNLVINRKATQGLHRQAADRSPWERPSVLKQIRETREAPKPPRRGKLPEQKKDKGGPEL